MLNFVKLFDWQQNLTGKESMQTGLCRTVLPETCVRDSQVYMKFLSRNLWKLSLYWSVTGMRISP